MQTSIKQFFFLSLVLIFLLSWLFHPAIVLDMTLFFVQMLFLLEKIILFALLVCSVIAPLVCGYSMFLYFKKKIIEVQMKQEEQRALVLANNRIDNTLLLEEGQTALISPFYQLFSRIDNRKVSAPPGQQQQFLIQEIIPQVTKLSALAEWKPVQGQLFLGLAPGMKKIIIPAKEAWHIVLAGPTGGGKSNTLMLLLLQLVRYYKTYIINPHWAEVEEDGRDWSKIAKHLALEPMWQKDIYSKFFDQILLILETRKAMKRKKDFRYVQDPMFITIDEYPIIKDEWKDAPKILGKLLREARKYYIFIIMSSQDLLLDTIGGTSGARECYRTAFAFDGDRTTLNVVIKDYAERKKYIDTAQLGRDGKALLRSIETPEGETIRVPFVDKAALELFFDEHIIEGSIEYISKQDTEKLPVIEQDMTLNHVLETIKDSNQSIAELSKIARNNQKEVTDIQAMKIVQAIAALEYEKKELYLGTIIKKVNATGEQLYWAHHDAIERIASEIGVKIAKKK